MIVKTTYNDVRFSLRKALNIIFETNATIKNLPTKPDIQKKVEDQLRDIILIKVIIKSLTLNLL